MDHDITQAIGASLCPTAPIEAGQCWVGVVSRRATNEHDLKATDFIWYKTKRTNSVDKVLRNYAKVTNNGDVGDMVFKLRDRCLERTSLVGDLLPSSEKFVALHVSTGNAALGSSNSADRAPLRALDANTHSRPFSPTKNSSQEKVGTPLSVHATPLSRPLRADITPSLGRPPPVNDPAGAAGEIDVPITSSALHAFVDANPHPSYELRQRIVRAYDQFVALGGRSYPLAEKVAKIKRSSPSKQPQMVGDLKTLSSPVQAATPVPPISSPSLNNTDNKILQSLSTPVSYARQTGGRSYEFDHVIPLALSSVYKFDDATLEDCRTELKNVDGYKFLRHVSYNPETEFIHVIRDIDTANPDRALHDNLFQLIAIPACDNSTGRRSELPFHSFVSNASVQSSNGYGIKAAEIADYIVARSWSSATGNKCVAYETICSWQLVDAEPNLDTILHPPTNPDTEISAQDPAQDGITNKTLSSPPSPSNLDADRRTEASSPDVSEPLPQPIKQTFQLQRMMEGQPLEVLEKAVTAGTRLLDHLKKPLVSKASKAPDANQWIEQIEKVQRSVVKTKTVVGVVGNTGAGKSSVINALLDEERLVPTNCMRACTAVITEISYNDQETPYRAEIEFIERADWEKELQILFQDLFNEGGRISRDAASEDSEAGVAYAKIKAVYPNLVKEQIEQSSIEDLMKHQNVAVLGKHRNINEQNSLVFYRKLQSIIDSKEKTDQKKEKRPRGVPAPPKEPSLWPLINVVRLYIKAPALSTGAVIVDLPGVHDSNAARAKVAENYMKQCTGLWIVAPINRAVDDKAAKSLLGESFKRQLKMDGGFSTITFICSKTDDISIMEAQDSLGLEDEIQRLESQCDEYRAEVKHIKGSLEDLKNAKKDIDAAADEAIDQQEIWETLKDDAEAGKTVFPPSAPKSGKRKRGSEKPHQRSKKRRCSDGTSDCEHSSSDFVDEEEDETEESAQSDADTDQRLALTLEQINEKLGELRATKKNARQQKADLDEQMRPLRTELQEVEKKIEAIEVEERAICIAGRNQYSLGAIQADFAAGIKELDQEIAEEEDAANFNPELDVRDYEEVARSLPVFCVSSRGYQKLMGRLRQESDVPGFKTIEQTQIPQLQEHCKSLTVSGRVNACNHFLATLSQLLNSLALWASNDGSGSSLTKEQRTREEQILHKSLKKLESDLDNAVSDSCKHLHSEFEEQIYDRFDTAVQAAVEEAVPTVIQWGSPVNREDRAAGGYYWSSYKAICRRNGVFTNTQGSHDWNAKLAEPIMRNIAAGWERVFTRRTISVLNDLAKHGLDILKAFHALVANRAQTTGSSASGIYLLSQQLPVYQQMLKQISESTKDAITSQQRDINREFTPVVGRAMLEAYERCTAEVGPGQYMRMKAIMNSHVNDARHTMFSDSANAVRDLLKMLLKTVRKTVEEQVDNIFQLMRRDYLSALGGGSAKYGEVMPKPQRVLRQKITVMIDKTEHRFLKVVDPNTTHDEEMSDDYESEADEDEDDDDNVPGLPLALPNAATQKPNPTSLPTADTQLTTVKTEVSVKKEPLDDGLRPFAADGHAERGLNSQMRGRNAREHEPWYPAHWAGQYRGQPPSDPRSAQWNLSPQNGLSSGVERYRDLIAKLESPSEADSASDSESAAASRQGSHECDLGPNYSESPRENSESEAESEHPFSEVDSEPESEADSKHDSTVSKSATPASS